MAAAGDKGERLLTREAILSLPWPSAEQRSAFAAHVC
jgi:hypothetical protein